ncbi:MAG: hypothetical protein Q9181_006769 [Wetmoreana brouardii]
MPARDSYELRNADNAECWKRVKGETGYDKYRDYLIAHQKNGIVPRGRLVSYLDERSEGGSHHYCSIFDISETGVLSHSAAISSYNKGSDEQAEQILASIRGPDPQVLARVLLVEHSDWGLGLPARWIDAIGLGLRTPPALFEAFLTSSEESKTSQNRVLVRAGIGTIGRTFFTTARNYLPGRSYCPPTVLILNPSRIELNNDLVTFTTDLSPPRLSASVMPKMDDNRRQTGLYELLLSGQLERYKGSSIDLKMVLVHVLLPLLQSCLGHLRDVYDETNTKYLDMSPVIRSTSQDDLGKPMEVIRYKLRRAMRSLEQSLGDYKTYLRKESIRKPEQYEASSVTIEEAETCLDVARGLESEIRDWLQVYVGNCGIQSSKKSIELSNIQIEETKRGRLSI